MSCSVEGGSCKTPTDCCYEVCTSGTCSNDPCSALPNSKQEIMRSINYGEICNTCKSCEMSDVVLGQGLTLPESATIGCQTCQRSDGSYGPQVLTAWKMGQEVNNVNGVLVTNPHCDVSIPQSCTCVTNEDCIQMGASQQCYSGFCGIQQLNKNF